MPQAARAQTSAAFLFVNLGSRSLYAKAVASLLELRL